MPVLCVSMLVQASIDSFTHQVSVAPGVCAALATVMRGYEGRLAAEHIEKVRALYGSRFFQGNLAILPELVERDGAVHVSFLPATASRARRRPSFRERLATAAAAGAEKS